MEFTNSVAFLLLPLLVSCAAAQNIVEIHTRTLDSDRVGEIAPTLEIVNSNFDSCVITELGNPDREEFEAGQIDPFWVTERNDLLQNTEKYPHETSLSGKPGKLYIRTTVLFFLHDAIFSSRRKKCCSLAWASPSREGNSRSSRSLWWTPEVRVLQ